MLASFLDTIKSFSSGRRSAPRTGDKRARESEVDCEDDEVIITDVLQTPPNKRLKNRDPGGDESVSSFGTLVNGIRNWSDRYIWRHVVGSRAPQSEPEILREDLGQAEEEMDRLDILNSVSKPYPSATNERSNQALGRASGLTRPPIASFDGLYQHETQSKFRSQTSTFAQETWRTNQPEAYPHRQPVDLGESYLHYCPEKYREKNHHEMRGTSTRPQQYSKEKYSNGRQKPHSQSWDPKSQSKNPNSSSGVNGSETVKAKLNFTIGQSSQYANVKQAKGGFRRSKGKSSRVTSTAEEVVRLEERNRYRQVLSQFYVTLPPDDSQGSPGASFRFGREDQGRQDRPRIKVTEGRRRLSSASSVLQGEEVPVSLSPVIQPPAVYRVTASPTKTPGRSQANVFLHKPEQSTKSIKYSSFTASKSKLLDSSTSGPLGDDWTRKWREMVSEESLLRAREISKEERKLEAIRAKEKEEQEALAQEIRQRIREQEAEEEEEEDAFMVLTDGMERKIDAALAPGYPEDQLANGFRMTIKRSDMATLNNLNWLNDEIMNCYFTLITERSKESGRCKVHAFNSFFYPKLIKTGYATLRRWTKKVDIFAMDIVAVPIHLGMHWCLAMIDMRKKCITYYDSLKGSNPQCLNALQNYLLEESLDKKKQPFDLTGWTTASPKDIPEQLNGCDCGVFTCKYAEYITRDAAFNFDQRHMPYFRRRMVYEILTMKLL